MPNSESGRDSPPPASEPATAAQRGPWLGRHLVRILSVILALAVTGVIFAFKDRVVDLQSYGYAGAFLISLLASATIFIPIPGVLVIFALGAVLNPFLVGLASGVGAGLGEFTGYLAGYGGQAAWERNRAYQRLAGWMQRRGGVVVAVLAFIPNPAFDVLGVAAGMLRYPLWKFLLMCCLGRIPRSIGIAYAGAVAVPWVAGLIEWLF